MNMVLLPNQESEKLAKITIFGDVQGVFFRRSAKRKAEQLSLRGIARNESDGTVLIEIEGPESKVNDFVAWAESGPDSANVTSVDVSYAEPKNYYGFKVE
jgi:acylphosphatase